MESREQDRSYDPAKAEEKWYGYWMELGLFHADPSRPGAPYSIVIPPRT